MSSYKVKDISRPFKGEPGDDVEMWLDRFQTAMRIADPAITDQSIAQCMPLFLDGAAYRTWKQLNAKQKDDFDEIKKALRRVYGMSKCAAWQKLKALHLFPGEPVDVLADEAEKLLSVIGGVQELVSLAILDALPSDVAEKVRMAHGETLETEKVVSCTKALLINDSQTLTASAARGTSRRCAESQSRTLPVGRTSRVRCEGCLRFGHTQQFCNVTCFRCGQRGHLQRFCANLSRRNSGNGFQGMAAADPTTPGQEFRSAPTTSMAGQEEC
jgi:hypothetical protein